MDKNILVIGNGFDLYHGLPTRYIDFVNYAKYEFDNKKETYTLEEFKNESKHMQNMFIKYFIKVAEANHTWIDCEQEIKRVVTIVMEILDKTRNPINGISEENSILSTYDIMLDKLRVLEAFNKFFVVDVAHYDVEIESKYFHPFYGVHRTMIMNEMKNDLDDLIIFLEKYLKEKALLRVSSKKSNQIQKIHPDYVVNFNYTDTYKLYDISDEDVFHIHGRVGSSPNNMVLGFDDDDEKNLDTIYFKKYFQRIQKLTGIIDKDKFKKDDSASFVKDESREVISHFFGLSMSKTDGDRIKEIEELSTKCIVYYHNPEDYAQKIINLIDVFGKNNAVEKIQSKKIELVEIEKPVQK